MSLFNLKHDITSKNGGKLTCMVEFAIQSNIQNTCNILISLTVYTIRNEKVGCSIHLSGTNTDKGSLLCK